MKNLIIIVLSFILMGCTIPFGIVATTQTAGEENPLNGLVGKQISKVDTIMKDSFSMGIALGVELNQFVFSDQITATDGVYMNASIKTLFKGEFWKPDDVKFDKSKSDEKTVVRNFLKEIWSEMRQAKAHDFEKSPDTGVAKEILIELGTKLATLPQGHTFFRKIKKLLNDRIKMIEANEMDWGMAEMLAYATLLVDGHPVRISGQDVERGTFSHRHAVVKTEEAEKEIITLNHLKKDQGKFDIYNSLLSEYAVLGFEYGYSLTTPNGLTIWEAQFGDFYNGAQIMVDQFIMSGEDKWRVGSGLTMLLPHGYEGQGGEHSSGRMERFLQQCADLNVQICNNSTPSNHFHCLRRQIERDFRKPLIVFTPKNLLRHPRATSTLDDLAKGSYQEVIDDVNADVNKVDTVILCSGKFYYEITEQAEERKVNNAAFVRVEQLYPLPKTQLDAINAKYKNATKIIWAQEEPENMGAWSYIFMALKNPNMEVVARHASSAPATGSSQAHKKRLAVLYNELFEKIAEKK